MAFNKLKLGEFTPPLVQRGSITSRTSALGAEKLVVSMLRNALRLETGQPPKVALANVSDVKKTFSGDDLTAAQRVLGANPDIIFKDGKGKIKTIEVKFSRKKVKAIPTASQPYSAYDYVFFLDPTEQGWTSGVAAAKARAERAGVEGDELSASSIARGETDYEKLKDSIPDDFLARAIQARLGKVSRYLDNEGEIVDLPSFSFTISSGPGAGKYVYIDGAKVRVDLKFEQRLRRFVRQVLTEERKEG